MSNENQAAEILTLKAKLFDAGEQIEALHTQTTQMNAVLSEIVNIVGLQPNENNHVAFEDIIAAVRNIAPSQDAVNEVGPEGE